MDDKLSAAQARREAWWLTHLRMMHKRVSGLLESAGMDSENISPPKDIWFNDEALKVWFEDRRALQKELWREAQN